MFSKSFEEYLENSNRNNLINIEIISELEKIFFEKLEKRGEKK